MIETDFPHAAIVRRARGAPRVTGRRRTRAGTAARGRNGVWAVVAALPLAASPAAAFDLFGLFGSQEEPLAPSATALPYGLKIQGTDDSDLEKTLEDTSTLHRLRREPPPDGEGLVRRAEADLRRLPDALSGYRVLCGPGRRSDRGGGARRRGLADRRGTRRGIGARPRPGAGPHRGRCRAALHAPLRHRARPARGRLPRRRAAAALHPDRRRNPGALQPRARPRGADRRSLPRARPSLRQGGVARSRRRRRGACDGRDLHRRSRAARRPRRGHRRAARRRSTRGRARLHLRGAGRPVFAQGALRHAPARW